jgi:hypothetical protein
LTVGDALIGADMRRALTTPGAAPRQTYP